VRTRAPTRARARTISYGSKAPAPRKRATARTIGYGSKAPKLQHRVKFADQPREPKSRAAIRKVTGKKKTGGAMKHIKADPRPSSTKSTSKLATSTDLVVHDIRDYNNTTSQKDFMQIDKAAERDVKRTVSGYKKWEDRIARGINATANVTDRVMKVVNPILDASAVADPMNIPLAVAGNAFEAIDHLIQVTSDSHKAVKKTVQGGKALKAMITQGDVAPLMLMNMPST